MRAEPTDLVPLTSNGQSSPPSNATAPFPNASTILLGLYKIFFHFKFFVHECIIRILPPIPAMPTLLQYYRVLCNIRPPPDHPFVCHTQYNIRNGNIV